MIYSSKLNNIRDYIPQKLKKDLKKFSNRLIQPIGYLKTKKYVRDILNSGAEINLEIGAGSKKGINSWITLDLNFDCDIYWNLNWSLPFPDNSIQKIYSSHVLEHFSYNELLILLNSCYKALSPGGSFSICVPNARVYLSAYSRAQNLEEEKYLDYKPAYNFNSRIDYVNYIAYMDGQHKYMFDEENIVAILEKIGFKNAQVRSFDASLDLAERHIYSLYAIAYK